MDVGSHNRAMAVISDRYFGLSDMGSRAIWWIVTTVSEELSASIFSAEEFM
jgi:hypothetical protein